MTLRLSGDTSGFTEIKAADAAGDNSIKLPAANGSANQLLQNGGTAGELQYTSAGGGLQFDSNGDLMLGASSFAGFAGGDRRFLINGATNARQEFGVGGSQIGGLYADANRLVVYTSSTDHLSFQTNGTERVQITSTGALALMAGSPGIDFSATQPAAARGTMTSETLDSYEEGTFTPYVSAGADDGSGGLAGYSVQSGRYTKIGNKVFTDIYLRFNSDARSTGAHGQIRGLPFNISSLVYGNVGAANLTRGGGTSSFQNSTDQTTQHYGSANIDLFTLYYDGSLNFAFGGSNNANIGSTFYIGTFCYQTNT